ncbi:hypothetical protein [Liberiplasma polymorphum]|uniref:hypothetical protein n=1 Tax=Liberiplasma polymorphum TaxID=3374570 RepID=UPI0037757F5E
MALFNKNKNLVNKQKILSKFDELYVKSTKNNLTNISQKSLEIRKIIVNKNLRTSEINQIMKYFDQMNGLDLVHQSSFVSNLLDQMNDLINRKNKSMTMENQYMLANEQNTAKISNAILQLNQEIVNVDAKIEDALKTNQKNLWIVYSQRRKTIHQKISLLQQDLERVAVKSSTIDVSMQVQQSSQLTKELEKQSSAVNLIDIAMDLEQNQQNAEQILDESNELDNLINVSTSQAVDFEKARENYLLESNEKASNPASVKDEVVKE